jgi:methyltransferase OMS1
MRPDHLSLFLFANPLKFGSNSNVQLNSKSQLSKLHERNPHIQSRRQNIITTTSLVTVSILSTSTIFKPEECSAISSSEAETSYDKYAKTYDDLDGGSIATSLGIEESRDKLLKQARGNVLEVAVGTGLNLSKYKFASSPSAVEDGVTSLTLLDISDGMLSEARAKLDTINIPSFVDVKFIKVDATSSEITSLFGEESFDTVVDTFSLCVMGNDGAKNCLRQMRNVVKKDVDGGKILLIENSRSSNSILGWYQDLTAEAAAKVGGKGCVSNQNVSAFIRGIDGLQLEKEEEFASGLFRSFICVKS